MRILRFLLLCLLLLTVFIGCAYASQVYADVDKLTVYASKSTSSKSMGTVGYGFPMELLDMSGKWAKVLNGAGQVGYCALSSLTAIDPNTYNETVCASVDGAKAYALPSTGSKMIWTLNSGGEVTLHAITKDGKWCRVSKNGVYAYMRKGELREKAADDWQDTDDEPWTETDAYAAEEFLYAYKSANKTSKYLGKLPFGTHVTLIETEGNWAYVRNDAGVKGYCPADQVTTRDPNGTPVKYFAKSGTKGYALPETGAKTSVRFSAGDEVMVAAVTPSGEWGRAFRQGEYIFVPMDSLVRSIQDEQMPVYVTAYYVKAFKSATSSSKSLGSLPFGSEMTLLSTDGEWAKVKNAAGTVGYVRTNAISTVNPNGESVLKYANTDNVKVYSFPGGEGKLLRTLSAGEEIEATSSTQDGKWTRVKASSNAYGFVSSSLLTEASPPDDDFEYEPPEDEASEYSVYVTAYYVKAFKSATSTSKYLGSLPFGSEMTCLAVEGEWAKVRNAAGTVGYCKRDSLSETDPNGSPRTYYAGKDGAYGYSFPDTEKKKTITYRMNEEIMVVAVTQDGKWMRVIVSEGTYAYVLAEQAALTPIETEVPVYVTAYSVKAYKSASADSKYLGALPFGSEMTLLEANGDWAKVRNTQGTVGYVKSSGISEENPNFDAYTMYAVKDGVKIHSFPDTAYKAVKTLSMNDSAEIVAKTNDGKWLRADLDTNGYGYALSEHFSESATERETPAYVSGYTMTAYIKPDASSKELGRLGFATEVTALGEELDGGWIKVRNAAGNVGYCKVTELTKTNPNTAKKTYYARTAIKAYVLPETSSTVRIAFAVNNTVSVVAVTADKEWARIVSGSVYAYVKMDGLSTQKVQDDTSGYQDPYFGTAGETIEKVIALAIKQYGKPYVYAEEGPDAFDCSGLTQYCFEKEAGIKLKRSAQAQGYDTRYERVETVSQLKRGDLVCMNTISDSDLSDHVGIYLGGGKFIHASSGGEKVIVSSITSGYYNRVFSWGLRIIP